MQKSKQEVTKVVIFVMYGIELPSVNYGIKTAKSKILHKNCQVYQIPLILAYTWC